MPFRPPARIVVERDVIERTIAEIEHQRAQLRQILDLMDSGRVRPAREAIANLLARLS